MAARTDIIFQDWVEQNISTLEDVKSLQEVLDIKRTELINISFQNCCKMLKHGEVLISNDQKRRIDPLKTGWFISLLHYVPQTPFNHTSIDLSKPYTEFPDHWSHYATSISTDTWIKQVVETKSPTDSEVLEVEMDIYYPLCTMEDLSRPGLYYYINDFDHQTVEACVKDEQGRFYDYNIIKSRISSYEYFDPVKRFDMERFCLLRFEEFIEKSQKKQRTE